METASRQLHKVFSQIPPHLVIRDFLGAQTVAELMEFALANEASFEPTGTRNNKHNPNVRVSLGTRNLGPFAEVLENRLALILPDLIGKLSVSPFEMSKAELQLVAHGDGAFYLRHIDTYTGEEDMPKNQRMISAVYYFHSRPKAFTGGELRLFPLSPESSDYADIEPDHDTLAVFPSWVGHEVRPIHCPSGRFADSRFAINCWLCRKAPTGSAPV